MFSDNLVAAACASRFIVMLERLAPYGYSDASAIAMQKKISRKKDEQTRV
jgi:hypothetical protein